MSPSSDEAPTGPIGRQTQQTHPDPGGPSPQEVAVRNQLTAEDPMGRWDTVRDLIAAVLLVAGLLLPWNLYSGVGIPGSSGTLFAVLGAVTLLSLISVALTFGTKTQNDRRRLLLNIPYLLR